MFLNPLGMYWSVACVFVLSPYSSAFALTQAQLILTECSATTSDDARREPPLLPMETLFKAFAAKHLSRQLFRLAALSPRLKASVWSNTNAARGFACIPISRFGTRRGRSSYSTRSGNCSTRPRATAATGTDCHRPISINCTPTARRTCAATATSRWSIRRPTRSARRYLCSLFRKASVCDCGYCRSACPRDGYYCHRMRHSHSISQQLERDHSNPSRKMNSLPYNTSTAPSSVSAPSS